MRVFFSLGCAAYGMRCWSEAIGHFQSALDANPELNLTAEKLAKAKARLEESVTGKYNLRKLLDDEKRGERFMDVADYIGPVKVADIPGKGIFQRFHSQTNIHIFFAKIRKWHLPPSLYFGIKHTLLGVLKIY
jgi:hypothetical protein